MVPILHTIDYITITIIVLLGVIISSRFRPSSAGDQARIEGLERKIEQLTAEIRSLRGQGRDDSSDSLTSYGSTTTSISSSSDGLSPAVRALADQGQIIQAIKLLREETGLGLKEAKDAVDAYKLRNR